jgi:PAS domain S-box-containing protein
MYEKSDVDAISPERLKEYFTKTNGGYQINKSIRDLCVFAHHNFLKDPPFGKMDCISCRNALIYMEPYLQKKALTTFHYALNPKGFLLLGKSETTSGVPDLFAAVEKNDKLYTRKDVPGRFMQVVSQRSEQVLSRAIDPSKVETIRTDFQKTADDILLTKYTPAGVVINEAMDIVHFRGNTANYLEQAPGKPSHNLLMMAKSGLGFELRNILHKAKTDKAAVVKENIPLSVNGSIQNISIEAIPLPNTLEPYYLILFHNNSVNGADWLATSNKKKVSAKTKKDEKDIQIQLLEQELAQAREDMRSITEEQEASNEELQSANEELLSGSEELQSLNEELETSKEELQSTNEELTVLNHELTGLNEQVTDARNYSESIVATLYQPLLVLDKHLRVKTANKAFYKTFNVNEQETEGVLIYDLGNRQWNIPELRTLLEEILPQKKQITDFEVIHNFTSIGERVILLSALEITREKKEEKLILLSIEDITEKSFARKKIEDSEKRYNMMLMKSPFAFAVLKGKNMVITIANDSVKEMWGKGKDLEGKPLLEVLPELKDSEFPSLLDNVYTTGTPFTGEALLASVFRNGKLEDVYFNFVYQPYLEADETISGVTIIAIEVTNEVIAKQKIKDSQQQLQNIFMQAPFALNIYEGKELVISLANKLFCEIIGKTESEILGKKLFDAFPETATQGLDKIISDIFSTGIPFKGNEFPVHFSKHGNEFKGYFDFIYQPIFDYNKNVSGVINVAVDVTDKVLARKKIEESEQRFHNLIYTSPSAIGILFGEDLVITIANEPIIEIWGKGKEIIGKKYFEALPELAEQGYKEVFNQVYKTGIPFNAIETPVNILQNGVATLKYYNFILYPQKDINGEINGIGIIASEVTSQAKYNLQIKESEERFRLLVMQAPVSIFVLRGEDFIIETMNQEMANFLDRKIEDSLNKPLFDVITEVKDQNYKKLLDTVYKTGTRYVSHELPLIINRNGRLENIFLKFVYEPLREADGTISGVMVLADEITDQVNARKAVEVSEKRFRLLTNNMPQKITNADAEGNVNFFNQQWIDDTGLSFDELMDDGWVKAMHPDDLELTVNNWKHSVATGDDFDMECRIQNKEGYYRWHLSRAVPIRDENGRIVMWVGSNTDIHEQKEQRELLETAVEKRTVELNKANKKLVHESLEKEKRADELIKINKELEAFTYVSSHDLQEPLRKIHIFAGRILEKENEKLSDTGKKYFHIMQDSASRMQTLIEDLLTFSGLSSAERKFEIKDLTDIIEKIKIELKESIEEKQAIIEIGELCPANIIVFQFHQLMQNLISNALKFSKPKYPPHIIIKSSMVEGSKVKKHKLSSEKKYCHITVTDNGIGFEKKFSEKIFEVFQKLHSKEEYTGTGIGLAIVRKIVDNHNGMITATSKLNKGTSFDIYIPANQNK